MNTKILAIFASVLLAAAGLTSCSRARTDAQITTDVKQQIQAESALKTEPIQVQANNGVVVLSGSVATDAARSLAENTTKHVQGVKGVVNNLQLVSAAAPPVYAAPPAEEKAPAAKPPAAKGVAPVRPPSSAKSAAPAMTPTPQPAVPPAGIEPAPPSTLAAAPAPAPASVTLPEGTALTVRLIDAVDTEKNKEGATFRASLDAPIMIEDKIAIPKNADVVARLVSAKSAGRFSGTSSVVLVLSQIKFGGKSYEVQTGEFTKQGGSRGKRSAAVIGGTAAAGAVIGAIAGGGKGAAIGAAAGAGAGTGVQAMTKGEQIKLPAETLLEFQLTAPLSVVPPGETPKRETIGSNAP